MGTLISLIRRIGAYSCVWWRDLSLAEVGSALLLLQRDHPSITNAGHPKPVTWARTDASPPKTMFPLCHLEEVKPSYKVMFMPSLASTSIYNTFYYFKKPWRTFRIRIHSKSLRGLRLNQFESIRKKTFQSHLIQNAWKLIYMCPVLSKSESVKND